MNDQFYRSLEDKFRGSRSTIHSRLNIYRPFLSPLSSLFPGTPGLDLGCGRGEWLEILQSEGIEPLGIDMDGGMLEACRSLQLPVIEGDAISHLATLQDESYAIISAFHLVEHIRFSQLQEIVSQAFRVLKPGGILIMETPNPENIKVGTSSFYIDPTHQRPIPHQLLSFLPEYQGFARTKVLRLQHAPKILQKHTLGLHDVFTESSPDYAVVAQKPARIEVLEKFDPGFSKEHGLSLEALSKHYDAGIRAPIARIDSRLREFEMEFSEEMHETSKRQQALGVHVHAIALDAQRLRGELKNFLEDQQKRSQSLLQHAEQRALIAEQRLQSATVTLEAMRASTFWKMLSPARWLVTQFKMLLTKEARPKAASSQCNLQSKCKPINREPEGSPQEKIVPQTEVPSEQTSPSLRGDSTSQAGNKEDDIPASPTGPPTLVSAPVADVYNRLKSAKDRKTEAR